MQTSIFARGTNAYAIVLRMGHHNNSHNGAHETPESIGVSKSRAPIPQLGSDFPASEPSRKWWPFAALPFLAVALVICATLAVLYIHRPTRAPEADTATAAQSSYLVGKDKYVCGVGALNAILCENVDTHAVTKYEIPHYLGAPDMFNVSPDGSKILFSSFANSITTPNETQHFYVVDKNFELIKQLPSEPSTQDGYDYAWLPDSESLVYDLRTQGSDGQFGPSRLYVYNVNTGKTRMLTNPKDSVGFYYPTVTRSGRIIAYGNEPTGEPETLAAISSTDGSVQNIDTSAVYQNLDPQARVFYNQSSDLFYASGVDTHDPKDVTVVSRLVSNGNKLKLIPLATYQKDFDSTITVTTKGMLLDTSSTQSDGSLAFYDGQHPITKLSMNLHMLNNGMSGLVNLPFVKPADTNKLTASDYVYEYGTPPPGLDQFVKQLASRGCKPGQYRAVSLEAFDGDQQAVVEQGVCGNAGPGASHYYVYQDGAYKDVLATEQGVSCQDAARLGLSKVVLPNCIPSGRGL